MTVDTLSSLAPDLPVVDMNGRNIGYLKNNGSFVNLDKKVSGYALQEVAKTGGINVEKAI